MTVEIYTAPLFSVFVQGSPRPQPRARATAIAGHARMYDPGTAKAWRERVWSHLLPFKPLQPWDEPLALALDFEFQRPSSHWSKRGGLKPNAPTWFFGRKDWDNLGKAVSDELKQAGFIVDDDRIVDARVTKQWSNDPARFGCSVALYRLS